MDRAEMMQLVQDVVDDVVPLERRCDSPERRPHAFPSHG